MKFVLLFYKELTPSTACAIKNARVTVILFIKKYNLGTYRTRISDYSDFRNFVIRFLKNPKTY